MAMQLNCVTALIVATKSGLLKVWLNMTKYDWMFSSKRIPLSNVFLLLFLSTNTWETHFWRQIQELCFCPESKHNDQLYILHTRPYLPTTLTGEQSVIILEQLWCISKPTLLWLKEVTGSYMHMHEQTHAYTNPLCWGKQACKRENLSC